MRWRVRHGPGRDLKDAEASGARRNGWLLAPMIAQMVTREVMGGESDGVFDPGRFEGP